MKKSPGRPGDFYIPALSLTGGRELIGILDVVLCQLFRGDEGLTGFCWNFRYVKGAGADAFWLL
jgi:hypothetical protein